MANLSNRLLRFSVVVLALAGIGVWLYHTSTVREGAKVHRGKCPCQSVLQFGVPQPDEPPRLAIPKLVWISAPACDCPHLRSLPRHIVRLRGPPFPFPLA